MLTSFYQEFKTLVKHYNKKNFCLNKKKLFFLHFCTSQRNSYHFLVCTIKMSSKSNNSIGINIFSSQSQPFICNFLYNLFKEIHFITMLSVIKVFVQRMFFGELPIDSLWVTIISSKYFLLKIYPISIFFFIM